MSPRTAAAVARAWTRLYTANLPAGLRDARREEIESDLWESLADAVAPDPRPARAGPRR